MAEEELLVRIGSKANTAGLDKAEKEVKEVGDAVEKAGGKAKKASFDFKSFAKNAGIGATAVLGGLGLLGKQTLDYTGKLESMRISLKTVTGSFENADKAMKVIKKTAEESPFFEVETLGNFVQLMAAAGQETDTAIDSALRFGDVAAAFGKGNAEMKRMGNTISQVIGKGKADVVDFKELVNAGWVSVRNDVASAMELTMEQFEELVSAGQIGYEEIAIAADKFTGAAEEQSDTWNAVNQRMSESWSNMMSSIVTDTGLFDKVKEVIGGFADVLSERTPQIAEFFGTLVNNEESLSILAGIIGGLLVAAAVGFVVAFGAVILSTLAWVAAGAALGLILGKLWPVIDTVSKFVAKNKEVMHGLISFIAVLAIPTIKGLIIKLGVWAATTWSTVIPAIAGTVIALGPLILIAGGVALVVALVSKAWANNWGNIRQVTENVVNYIIGMINKLTRALSKLQEWLDSSLVGKMIRGGLAVGTFGLSESAFSLSKLAQEGGGLKPIDIATDTGGGQSFSAPLNYTPDLNYTPANLSPAGGLSSGGDSSIEQILSSLPALNQSGGVQNFNVSNNIFGDVDTEAMIRDLAYSVSTE